jgi:D-beta-D-heptose 7-phosphate kinase/D-beta-D-heptose 1-phosphate adenosyltransferase
VSSPKLDWKAVVASLSVRKLLVIGDVMLDEYVSGDARRVCPEAPVPVVETAKRWSTPGGAANAAANAVALGGRVILGGATGEDQVANELAKVVREAGIDPSGFVADSARPTTSKMRVLARGQQVIRVDTESLVPLSHGPFEMLAAWAERSVTQCGAVLLSDYGKGVCRNALPQRVIEAAKRVGCPVVVDPKGSDVSRYHGATVVKPNLGELGELTGQTIRTNDELLDAGDRLAEELEGTTVLVTRGAEGMALFRSGETAQFLPAAPARRVYDVTGAGDTAAAALALALAAGLSLETAARVANAAAGVAVSKVGTATVSPAELLDALLEEAPEFRTASE